jgi:hypothetical protein
MSIGSAKPLQQTGVQNYIYQIYPGFVREQNCLIIAVDTFNRNDYRELDGIVGEQNDKVHMINMPMFSSAVQIKDFVEYCFRIFGDKQYVICDYIEFVNPNRQDNIFYIEKEDLLNSISNGNLYKWFGYMQNGKYSNLIVNREFSKRADFINNINSIQVNEYGELQPPSSDQIIKNVYSIMASEFPIQATHGGRAGRRKRGVRRTRRRSQKYRGGINSSRGSRGSTQKLQPHRPNQPKPSKRSFVATTRRTRRKTPDSPTAAAAAAAAPATSAGERILKSISLLNVELNNTDLISLSEKELEDYRENILNLTRACRRYYSKFMDSETDEKSFCNVLIPHLQDINNRLEYFNIN